LTQWRLLPPDAPIAKNFAGMDALISAKGAA
jgi:hypothetical protein